MDLVIDLVIMTHSQVCDDCGLAPAVQIRRADGWFEVVCLCCGEAIAEDPDPFAPDALLEVELCVPYAA